MPLEPASGISSQLPVDAVVQSIASSELLGLDFKIALIG